MFLNLWDFCPLWAIIDDSFGNHLGEEKKMEQIQSESIQQHSLER